MSFDFPSDGSFVPEWRRSPRDFDGNGASNTASLERFSVNRELDPPQITSTITHSETLFGLMNFAYNYSSLFNQVHWAAFFSQLSLLGNYQTINRPGIQKLITTMLSQNHRFNSGQLAQIARTCGYFRLCNNRLAYKLVEQIEPHLEALCQDERELYMFMMGIKDLATTNQMVRLFKKLDDYLPQSRLESLSPQAFSGLLAARVSFKLFQTNGLCTVAGKRLHEFSISQLCLIVRALKEMNYIQEDLLVAISERYLLMADKITPKTWGVILGDMTRTGFYPQKLFAYVENRLRHDKEFEPSMADRVSIYFAQLIGNPENSSLQDLIFELVDNGEKFEALNQYETVLVLYMVAVLSPDERGDQVISLLKKFLKNGGTFGNMEIDLLLRTMILCKAEQYYLLPKRFDEGLDYDFTPSSVHSRMKRSLKEWIEKHELLKDVKLHEQYHVYVDGKHFLCHVDFCLEGIGEKPIVIQSDGPLSRIVNMGKGNLKTHVNMRTLQHLGYAVVRLCWDSTDDYKEAWKRCEARLENLLK